MNREPGAWMVIYCLGTGAFLLGKRGAWMHKAGTWNFFGGHINPGESPEQAVLRELREETGCGLDGAVHIATIEEEVHGAANYVHIVAGRAQGQPRPDHREVVEAAFFGLDVLPAPMSDLLRERLPGWVREFGG